MSKIKILLFLFSIIATHAQTVSGTIFSKERNQPVPYVRLGIEKEESGVISDEKGGFSIDLSKANASGKIKIEVAGYENYTETVENFLKHTDRKIFLKEKVQHIQEVIITPKNMVDKNWGVNNHSKSRLYILASRTKTSFQETAIKFTARKRTKIKNINLNIASYKYDKPIVLRYSIYNEKDGYPGENILDEELTVELTQDMIKSGTFTLDLNNRNIWIQGKFFIGIQVLNEFDGKMLIPFSLLRAVYTRKSYGAWFKMPLMAPAINIDVKVKKDSQNEEEK